MRSILTVLFTTIAIGCCLPLLRAAEISHSEARAAFEKMRRQATDRTRTIDQAVGESRLKLNQKRFDIDVPNFDSTEPPLHCGVAIWFELRDGGTYVNPTKHRWNPKERFFIHIEPAVPVHVSLHQNYPEDRPPSRQVFPDVRYPETFSVIPAGQVTRLPVRFRMDDDLRDEIMSMVVIRADSQRLPLYGTNQSSPSGGGSVSGPGATFRKRLEETSRLFTRANDEARERGEIGGHTSRFIIIGPDEPDCPEFSERPVDVQFFLFGVGDAHQFQITLHK